MPRPGPLQAQQQHLLRGVAAARQQAGQQRIRIALAHVGPVQRAAGCHCSGRGGRGGRLVPVLPAGAVLLVVGAPAAGYLADLPRPHQTPSEAAVSVCASSTAGHRCSSRASGTDGASMPHQHFWRCGRTSPAPWVLTGVGGRTDQALPARQTWARATQLWARTEQKKACGLATGCGGCFPAGFMGSSAHRRSSSCCQGAIVAHPCTRACKGMASGSCVAASRVSSPKHNAAGVDRCPVQLPLARLLYAPCCTGRQALPIRRPLLIMMSP